MTLEHDPLLTRLAAWYLDQFVVLCAGGAPVPWTGPLSLEPPPRIVRVRPPAGS